MWLKSNRKAILTSTKLTNLKQLFIPKEKTLHVSQSPNVTKPETSKLTFDPLKASRKTNKQNKLAKKWTIASHLNWKNYFIIRKTILSFTIVSVQS